jgi:hypothetical protein
MARTGIGVGYYAVRADLTDHRAGPRGGMRMDRVWAFSTPSPLAGLALLRA